jgi:hypothetical protein
VVLVLVTLFVDTVFFGVFYPVNACENNKDQVFTNSSKLSIASN